MKKILVTGATGFIGNYVIKKLVEQNNRRDFQIIASSSNALKAKTCWWMNEVIYIPCDLTQINVSINYFDFFEQPDLMIHLAWEGLPNYKDSFHLENNLPRHYAFLKNIIENGL